MVGPKDEKAQRHQDSFRCFACHAAPLMRTLRACISPLWCSSARVIAGKALHKLSKVFILQARAARSLGRPLFAAQSKPKVLKSVQLTPPLLSQPTLTLVAQAACELGAQERRMLCAILKQQLAVRTSSWKRLKSVNSSQSETAQQARYIGKPAQQLCARKSRPGTLKDKSTQSATALMSTPFA